MAARPAHSLGEVLMNSTCSHSHQGSLPEMEHKRPEWHLSAELPPQASVSKKGCLRLKGALCFKTHSGQCKGAEATYCALLCKLHITVTGCPLKWMWYCPEVPFGMSDYILASYSTPATVGPSLSLSTSSFPQALLLRGHGAHHVYHLDTLSYLCWPNLPSLHGPASGLCFSFPD